MKSNAKLTLKKAAEFRNDESMIAATAYKSLIAKEIKKHYQCYRYFTWIVSTNNNSESSFTKKRLYKMGNHKAFCQIIDKEILKNHKCIPMDVLLEKYGIGLS